MTQVKCVFCGQQASYEGVPVTRVPDTMVIGYVCKQCGSYVIDEHLQKTLAAGRSDTPFRIACVLHEKRLRGITGVLGVFDDDMQEGELHQHLSHYWRLSELLAEFPKATEMMDRSLMNLSRRVSHPMEPLLLNEGEMQFYLFTPMSSAFRLYEYLKQSGFVTQISVGADGYKFTISPDGWKRIDELARTRTELRQAFVAMWFVRETDEIWTKGIEPAVEDAGYDPRRIDIREHNNKICDEIIAEIRRSRFIVADFTAGCCSNCETCDSKERCKEKIRPRGGVYFEAGFALGLSIPVIWIVRKDQLGQVHFDNRQYNYIDYKNADDLRVRLLNRIKATIV